MPEKLSAFARRFKEPSSWAGLAVLATVLGAPVGAAEVVIQAGAGICALLAFFLPERKSDQ